MDRRTFVSTSVLAVSSLALSELPAAGRAQANSNNAQMHVGLVTYNLARTWDIDTIIKNCTETRFEGVELRTTHAHGVEINLPADKRSEVRRKFADSPVRLVGLGSTCEFHSPDPAVVRKNVEEAKAFVKLAKDVGAGGVKVRPNGLPAGVPEEKTLEQIGKALAECGSFGADYGVAIRLEIHGRDTARVPRIQKILEYANHPNVFACWNCNPQDLEDGGLESNFKRVGSRIGLVHMRDLYVDYPFQQLIHLLQGRKYDGYCLAEIPESSDPIRVMHYFRALFLAYQS